MLIALFVVGYAIILNLPFLSIPYVVLTFLLLVKYQENYKIYVVIIVLLTTTTFYHPNYSNFKGIVTKVTDYGVQVQTFTRVTTVFTKEEFKTGDVIQIVGENVKKNMRWNATTLKAKSVSYITTTNSLESVFFKYHKSKSHTYSILFFQYEESLSFIGSLSLRLTGFLLIVSWLLRPYLGSEKLKWVRLAITIFVLVFVKYSFTHMRLVLREKLNVPTQICILLIMFPGVVLTPAFVLAYALWLLNCIDDFSKSKLFIVRTLLLSACFGTLNILQVIAFKVIRIFMGIEFVIALTTLLGINSEYFLESSNKLWIALFSNSFSRRLTINGSIHGFALILLIILINRISLRKGIILVLSVYLSLIFPPFGRVRFIDVKQGDATLIQLPFNADVTLIDTGKPSQKNTLIQTLNRSGVQVLDTLIVTHNDLDHSGNVETIKNVYQPRLVNTKGQNVPFMSFYLQDIEFDNENQNSLIFKHRYGVLFTGDAEKTQERLLLESDAIHNIDVLKLGHHGSKTSSDCEFIQAIKPKLAIVSSDPHVYNHPSPEVMRTLHNLGVPVLETSKVGDIDIYIILGFKIIVTKSGRFAII